MPSKVAYHQYATRPVGRVLNTFQLNSELTLYLVDPLSVPPSEHQYLIGVATRLASRPHGTAPRNYIDLSDPADVRLAQTNLLATGIMSEEDENIIFTSLATGKTKRVSSQTSQICISLGNAKRRKYESLAFLVNHNKHVDPAVQEQIDVLMAQKEIEELKAKVNSLKKQIADKPSIVESLKPVKRKRIVIESDSGVCIDENAVSE